MPVFGSESRARPTPYILSQDEVERLVAAAFQPAYQGLRRDTYSTLFALLACTGLRVSEAIGLCYEDVTADGLIVRCSKFRKSRLVPLHDTAQAHLERYLERRRHQPPFDDPHLFVSMHRKPLCLSNVESAFQTAARKIGLPRNRGQPRATPHSLRHTFAVRALETCPDDRDHITQHLLSLSTYLGHARVADTYWYLEATPELMRNIADRSDPRPHRARTYAGQRPQPTYGPFLNSECPSNVMPATTPVSRTPMRSSCCSHTPATVSRWRPRRSTLSRSTPVW